MLSWAEVSSLLQRHFCLHIPSMINKPQLLADISLFARRALLGMVHEGTMP